MFPMEEFIKRFQEVLDAFDDAAGEVDDADAAEELDELNADFEDVIFMLESTDADDEDAEEAIEDALAEMNDLLDGYRDLQAEVPELEALVERFQMAVQFAGANPK